MNKWLVVACLLAGGVALGAAAPASAVVSCTFVPPKMNVFATANGDTAKLTRSGGAILVNGVTCGAPGTPATVANTDTIKVTGALGRQNIIIDEGFGLFAPGKTVEATGLSEIEFVLALAGGTDALTVIGTLVGDNITVGTAGANVNGDDDADVTSTGVDRLTVTGTTGADKISANGGLGTGLPYPAALSVNGGDGNDTLTGGDADDYLSGDAGNDLLTGGEGDDKLYGVSGADRLSGGYGNDILVGGIDNDVQSGGPNNDVFYAECTVDGADRLSGGAGNDAAYYSCRTLSLTITLDNLANDGAAAEGDNVLVGIERVIGGAGGDTIVGSPGDDSLFGGAGNDIIGGNDGADLLSGDAGNDTITGGDGEDIMYGFDGADSFHALDDSADFVDGGSQPIFQFDVVLDKDTFDSIMNVP